MSTKSKYSEDIYSGFNSRSQVLWFIGVVGLLILLPLIVSIIPQVSKRDQYRGASAYQGQGMSYVFQELFNETGPIDILFLGGSTISSAFDLVELSGKLSKKVGRPAVIRSLARRGRSIDLDYIILHDLLKLGRRPKLVIVEIPHRVQKFPHRSSKYIWNPIEHFDFQKGISKEDHILNFIKLYAAKVLAAPADMFNLVRHVRDQVKLDTSLNKTLGAMLYKGALGDINIPTPSLSKNQVLHKGKKTAFFMQEKRKLSPFQNYFMQKIITLLKRENIKYAFYAFPLLESKGLPQPVLPTIQTPLFYDSNVLAVSSLDFQGKNNDRLFAGLYKGTHLSAAGARYNTKILTPFLLGLYESL